MAVIGGNISVPWTHIHAQTLEVIKMPSEAKALLTTQTEKPNHYSYLKEFRVEQCTQFQQHKCTQHRPYTCFYWHFLNQRRRRPVRKRDGSFNYSADNYCPKYDETTGECPDGDECPLLHRTAGDTERRYHLRYYKTCKCVHDTDSRGFCVKNGIHCAFAHGDHDLRPPVYDIKELQALECADADGGINGPNVLDKERSLMNEDPKWQDTNYVLANYKTEPCKRPPRLCRQGYACPQYHNSKDKRRSPRKFKYRSTPCPNVKHGEEWGEPSGCDANDQCTYCHTRTEQQFHPEIYKSTKCNDVQQAGYCPRGVFCAFAHVEQEMSAAREASQPLEIGTNLAEILNSALPPLTNDCRKDNKLNQDSPQNGSIEVSESSSTSSTTSNKSCSKAPGAQLNKQSQSNLIGNSNVGIVTSCNSTLNAPFGPLTSYSRPDYRTELAKKMLDLDANTNLTQHEKEQHKKTLLAHLAAPFYANSVESVVGNALDIDDALNLSSGLDNNLDASSPISNSISVGLASTGLLTGSAPVNIPRVRPFSPTAAVTAHSTVAATNLSHFQTNKTEYSNYLNSLADLLDFGLSQSPGSSLRNNTATCTQTSFSTISPGLNTSLASNCKSTFSISPNLSAGLTGANLSTTLNAAGSANQLEIQRLRDEVATCRQQILAWEDRVLQAREACEAWQRETEEWSRKYALADTLREEALTQNKKLQSEIERLQQQSNNSSPLMYSLRQRNELRTMSLPQLKQIQTSLRNELEELEKVIYEETATKCMVCEEQNRSVTLVCNHFVVCNQCAPLQDKCPYCSTPFSIS